MKFLFIVQEESRGHLMQAATLEEMLTRRGHEVVEILVGGSTTRMLPGFFNRSVHAPVKRFVSPRIFGADTGSTGRWGGSLVCNLLLIPEYVRSMYYISHRIGKSKADVVINFHEVLTGLTYFFLRPTVPYVAIGREYIFLHNNFPLPDKKPIRMLLSRIYTRLTSLKSSKRLALSLRDMPADPENNVVVIPPLLRREVTSLIPVAGDYAHGFLAKSHFMEDVLKFHNEHPDVPMHFFWVNPDADEVTRIDRNLQISQADETAFHNALAGCRVYLGTGGFESICEAMFLGKPMLMSPMHLVQELNAWDAKNEGAGIVSSTFALEPLLEWVKNYAPNQEFVYWVRSCERSMLGELESLTEVLPSRDILLTV